MPESQNFLVNNNSNLATWNLATDEVTPVGSRRIGPPILARYSRDARLMAGAFGDRSVRLGDARSLEWRTANLLGHDSAVPVLDFSPDDMVLASGSGGGVIKLWNVATNQPLLTLSTDSNRRSEWYQLCFSPNGSYLVCGALHNSMVDSEVIIWPAASPDSPVP
jgi:WD40 repeat protein